MNVVPRYFAMGERARRAFHSSRRTYLWQSLLFRVQLEQLKSVTWVLAGFSLIRHNLNEVSSRVKTLVRYPKPETAVVSQFDPVCNYFTKRGTYQPIRCCTRQQVPYNIVLRHQLFFAGRFSSYIDSQLQNVFIFSNFDRLFFWYLLSEKYFRTSFAVGW